VVQDILIGEMGGVFGIQSVQVALGYVLEYLGVLLPLMQGEAEIQAGL
jgi:hypothetical protein